MPDLKRELVDLINGRIPDPPQFVQVRPVREDGEGRDRSLTRAFEGDEVFAWGLYVTDDAGLPMHEEDFDSREAAVEAALSRASELGVSVTIDELDGTTSWRDSLNASSAERPAGF